MHVNRKERGLRLSLRASQTCQVWIDEGKSAKDGESQSIKWKANQEMYCSGSRVKKVFKGRSDCLCQMLPIRSSKIKTEN